MLLSLYNLFAIPCLYFSNRFAPVLMGSNARYKGSMWNQNTPIHTIISFNLILILSSTPPHLIPQKNSCLKSSNKYVEGCTVCGISGGQKVPTPKI